MTIFAFLFYLSILVTIGVLSYKSTQTSDDFMLGSRKMNFYLTAFAAHASDMSSWIFLAYPAAIITRGIEGCSIAIGLTVFMYLNWQYIAPKLREETEKYDSLTLSSYFESRFSDTTGIIRIFSALACFIFFTVYISASLKSLGIILNTIFFIPNTLGICLGIFLIVPYLFIGGYVTLAWTDCFQGLFLLLVILAVPLFAYFYLDISSQNLSDAAVYTTSSNGSVLFSFVSIFAWGLPYFGLPHVLTKFMGIKEVSEMKKAKWVGISWQILALSGATLIGLIASHYYQSSSINPEFAFIALTIELFPAFISTFILCAILGATITSMDSQILVVATSFAEDIYKKWIKKDASSNELLFVTRVSIFFVAFLSCVIAIFSPSNIMGLVSYAWYGLGAAFTPLVVYSLYGKRITKNGAVAGLVIGTLTAAVYPLIPQINIVPSIIPALILSVIAIESLSVRQKQVQ